MLPSGRATRSSQGGPRAGWDQAVYPKLPAQGGVRAERHPSRHPAVLPFASPSPAQGRSQPSLHVPVSHAPSGSFPDPHPGRLRLFTALAGGALLSGFLMPVQDPLPPRERLPRRRVLVHFSAALEPAGPSPVLCVQGLAGERISGSFTTSRTPGWSQGGRAQQVGGASSPARGRGRVPKAGHPVCARAGTGSRDTRMGPPWSHEPQPGRIWRELEQGKEGNAWGEADP